MTMRSLLSLVTLATALPANPLSSALIVPRTRAPPSSSCLPFPRLVESTVEETLERTLADDNLSPFLRDMVDEQRELQLNVGRAMDVLRKDYPDFLRRAPDCSIYHDAIALSASDGKVQLAKLPAYKNMCGVLRATLGFLYDADRSVVQSRMVYDPTRTQIRVSFNALLEPKLGGGTMHVDGISVYSVDLAPTTRGGAGKIVEHRVETLLVNGAALQPPYLNAFGFELAPGQQQQGGTLAGAGSWS